MTGTTRTAFRIYGRFAWPPLPPGGNGETSAPPPSEHDGVVELLFHGPERQDAGAPFPVERPFLRWLPRAMTEQGAAPTLDSAAANLAQLTREDLLALFNSADTEISVALDANSAAIARAPGLAFVGAALVEEWASSRLGDPLQPNALPTPTRRWPLARTFRSNGKPQVCTVWAGAAGNEPGFDPHVDPRAGSNVTVQLALATPWTQAGTRKPSYAFPFRVRYEPARLAGTTRWNGAPLPISRVIAGTRGAISDSQAIGPPDILAAHAAFELGGAVDFDRTTLNPARWRLGHFGISQSDAGGVGLHLPRDKPPAGYWPDDPSRFLTDTFGDLLTHAPKLAETIKLWPTSSGTKDFGEERWCIWFDDRDGPDETTIVYRSSFETDTDANETDVFDLTVTRDTQLKLALPGSGDDPTRVCSDDRLLLIELRAHHRISAKTLWASVDALVGTAGSAIGLRVELALGLRDAVVPEQRVSVGEPEQSASQLLATAAVAMRTARDEIAHGRPSESVSLLPELVFEPGRARFAVCMELAGTLGVRGGMGSDKSDVRLVWPLDRNAVSLPWRDRRARLTLWPDWGTLGVDTDPKNSPSVTSGYRRSELSAALTLPGFTQAAAGAAVTLRPDREAFAAQRATPEHRLVGFRLEPLRKADAIVAGRIGGLQVTLSPEVLQPFTAETGASADDSVWRFTPRRPHYVGTTAFGANYWPAEVTARLQLQVIRIRPVQIGGGGATGPLLLAMTDAKSVGTAAFTMTVDESIGGPGDRSLTARLYDRGEAGAKRTSYVVLSQQPFGFARVQPAPLEARGSIERAQVADYADGRWAFSRYEDFQRISFPPQSVGESMNKPRRFEIVDPDPRVTEVVPRPWAGDGALDPPQRRAVETRFTPSADVWIRPSDREQTFVEPEWELAKLWTRSGALGLGSALAAFRGEFLYGLPVGIDVARERGAPRTARISEIGALLGEPLAYQADIDDDPLAQALARRPERLEFWMRDPDSVVALAPARFEAGVSFALRETARHFPALKGCDREGDPRIDCFGLPGGAMWPIESLNFLRQLLDEPIAKGGTIEQIALSPTGGDADQRAEFLDGRLAIISETRNGFVQRHRVEILGRISVFWHRAKHVVVYERTANSSAQFPWVQDSSGTVVEGSRRPILRKVAEFIELLQPERSYPDAPGADVRSAGFLRALRFNQKTINVDSAWSEDVDTTGWRIPLWNRGFAQVSPQVYPRPDSAFVTAAEGEGDNPEVAQECLDPDNLYFYAEVEPTNPDSDLWPARPGIDFSAMPRPLAAHQRGAAPDGATPSDTREASAPRVPRGQRRFTWHLAPAARRTVINAGRGEEPVFAALETLTFSRATVDEGADGFATASDALALAGAASAVSVPTTVEVERATGLDDTALTTFARRLRGDLAFAHQALDSLRAGLDVAGPLHGVQAQLAASDPGGKLAQDFARTLQGRRLVVFDVLRTWLVDPARDGGEAASQWVAVTAAKAQGSFVEALTAAIDGEIRRALAPGLRQAHAEVGDLQRALASARTLVAEVEQDVRARIGRCGDELDAIQHSYDASKPWSADRLDRIAGQISAARDGVVADIGRAAEDAAARIATDLGVPGPWIEDRMRPALARAGRAVAGTLSDVGGGARGFLSHRRSDLEGIAGRLADQDTALDDAIGRYPDDAVAIEAVRQAVSGIRLALASGSDGLDRAYRDLASGEASVADIVGSLQSAIESLIDDADAALREVKATIAALTADARALVETASQAVIDRFARALTTLSAVLHDAASHADDAARLWFGEVRAALATAVREIADPIADVVDALDAGGAVATTALEDVANASSPARILDLIHDRVVAPAALLIGSQIDWSAGPLGDAELRRFVGERLRSIDDQFATLLAAANDVLTVPQDLRDALKGRLETAREAARKSLEQQLPQLQTWIDGLDRAGQDVAALRNAIGGIADTLDDVRDEVEGAMGGAQAYADRLFDAAGNLANGGLGAAPGTILNLWAAAASAPKLPNLEVARERLGYYYDSAKNLIGTTPAAAWFGRLGDELKALGLTLPFDAIEDRLIASDLKNLDVGKIFGNFGGIDLSRLFKGIKLPSGAGDAIKVTHAFDKTAFRAWVQIDIDVAMPGRKSLFAIGPFAFDFVDARLQATVRLEASKDSEKVAQTGSARLTTDADASVAGQSMVTLRQLVVRYDRDGGLKVDLDPKNIRINPSLRFIQDALAQIVPDQAGGLKILKDKGVPVGVSHDFSMPPVSLMVGTSGVSNLQIANQFSLIAYPDFRIANRFSLSSPELPFLFSIFVIGGTGYLIAESDYRPFGNELAVTVEAAAGGSAALGFAAGPVSGSVFVSLSIAIAYRKAAKGAGGGLTVSVVLVIAGNVDVAGIASVYIGLQLRLAYRDTGAIDGQGDLRIRIRISRFFTYSFRQNVQRQLRGPTRRPPAIVARGAMKAVAPAAPPPPSIGQHIIGARG